MLKRSILLLLVAISAPSHVLAECGSNETAHHYFDCGLGGDTSSSSLRSPAPSLDLSCVPIEWRCDGVSDCTNGADEKDCSYLHDCPSGNLICRNGGCVDRNFKCNRIDDCMDGTDERGCDGFEEFKSQALSAARPNTTLPTSPGKHSSRRKDDEEECGDDRYQCQNGACIPKYVVCDGVDDCPRGDDEWMLNCPSAHRGAYDMSTPSSDTSESEHQKVVHPTECSSAQTSCGDGTCIPLSWRCDGTFDCNNHSDEQDCDGVDLGNPIENSENAEDDLSDAAMFLESHHHRTRLCPADTFRCNSDECIPLESVCDRKNDCASGEDEAGQCGQCANHVCQHSCREHPHGPRCACPTGQKLALDGISCLEVDMCTEDGTKCQQICKSHDGIYTCSCEDGYELQRDEHTCRVVASQSAGSLFLSLGSEVRRMPLLEHHTDAVPYSVYQINGGSSGSVRSLAFNSVNQLLYMAVGGHNEQSHISAASGGFQRVLRDRGHGIAQIAVDWIGNNIYFTSKYPSRRPGISVCTANGHFCRQVLVGRQHHVADSGKRQGYRGLALDPLHGLMFWIDVYDGRLRIMKANMDGTNAQSIVDEKLAYPSGLSVDPITGDVYFSDVEKELIEKVNYRTLARSVVASSGVHHPFDLAYFGGHIYWSDWGTESLKMLEVGVSHASPHVVHSLGPFPYGIALNHSLYQQHLTPNPTDALKQSCPHIRVTVPEGDNGISARCLCPEGYERLENPNVDLVSSPEERVSLPDICWPLSDERRNATDEGVTGTRFGLALMVELCEKGVACGGNGYCEETRDKNQDVVTEIHCQCNVGWVGDFCEVADAASAAALSDNSGSSHVVGLLLLLLLVAIIVAVIYLYHRNSSVRNVIDDARHSAQMLVVEGERRARGLAQKLPDAVRQKPSSAATYSGKAADQRSPQNEVLSNFANPLFPATPVTDGGAASSPFSSSDQSKQPQLLASSVPPPIPSVPAPSSQPTIPPIDVQSTRPVPPTIVDELL